jgi:hypothetical protein
MICHVYWDEWPSTSSGEGTGLVYFNPSEENHDPATNAMALPLKLVGNLYRRIGIIEMACLILLDLGLTRRTKSQLHNSASICVGTADVAVRTSSSSILHTESPSQISA